ncbi:response regulator transcription factor [Paenibacillus agricola]|uniref:Response regulator n=1 Tax=Paenibacillus agricola TaxID=2716264 RepID=A0ABX0J6R5_9BACL|nr:response regulator [Paenibacillus agricola]NHN32122.1 response regulator [Paenibacillus agricola]
MNEPMTLCVIDDIKTIVDGIASQIPWEQYGIRVVGTATNGEDGLKLILQTRPQLIITDIRMPVMDGLSMVEQTTGELSNTKVIVLSGYNDFEYARQAVRLGVFEYLTKPFRPSQLVEVVLRAKEEREKELEQRKRLQELEEKMRESLPLLRQEYLKMLIRYKANESLACQRWSFLEIGFEPSRLVLMVVEIDDFTKKVEPLPPGEAELILFAVQNVLEETVSRWAPHVTFRDNIGKFVCLFRMDKDQDAIEIAEACCHNTVSYTKQTISIGLGLETAGLAGLPQSYRQAQTALACHFYTEGNSVIRFGDFKISPYIPVYASDLEQKVILSLVSGNSDKVHAVLADVFDQIQDEEVRPTPDYMANTYWELARKMAYAVKPKLSEAAFAPIEDKLHSLFEPTHTLKDWQQILLGLGSEIALCFKSRRTSDAQDVVQLAETFIREHLHLNMTVQDCARHVHLSPSHFASLFKKITGMTFVQFVTTERIKTAQELLVSGSTVQTVSEKLGYEDQKYFRELFKKHTGMTPSEFKDFYK